MGEPSIDSDVFNKKTQPFARKIAEKKQLIWIQVTAK
jgi:hypothetical protein